MNNNNNTRRAKNVKNNINDMVKRAVNLHEKRLSKGHLWGTRKLSNRNKKNLNNTERIARDAALEGLSNSNKFLYYKKYGTTWGKPKQNTLLGYLKETLREGKSDPYPYSDYEPTNKEKQQKIRQNNLNREERKRLIKGIEREGKKKENENKKRRELGLNRFQAHLEIVD